MAINSKLDALKEEISKEFLKATTVEEDKKLNKLANLANEMSKIVKPKRKLFNNQREFEQRLYKDTGCELFDVPAPETEEQYQSIVKLMNIVWKNNLESK